MAKLKRRRTIRRATLKHRRTVRRFTASGVTRTAIPKLTRKQTFARTKQLIFNRKSLFVASRRGFVF